MKTFKQLILKSILLMTMGLGIFFIFSSIQKKAHYKKVDIYRLDIVNSDLMKKHGIFEQKSNDENFVKIKVNLREE